MLYNKTQFKTKMPGNIRGYTDFGEQTRVLHVYLAGNKLNFHPNVKAGELLKLLQIFQTFFNPKKHLQKQ